MSLPILIAILSILWFSVWCFVDRCFSFVNCIVFVELWLLIAHLVRAVITASRAPWQSNALGSIPTQPLRNKTVNVYKIKHIYIQYTTYIDKHGAPMFVSPRVTAQRAYALRRH